MNLAESIRNDLLKFEGFKQVVEGEEDVICTMDHNGNELKIHVHDGEYILKVNGDELNEREMTNEDYVITEGAGYTRNVKRQYNDEDSLVRQFQTDNDDVVASYTVNGQENAINIFVRRNLDNGKLVQTRIEYDMDGEGNETYANAVCDAMQDAMGFVQRMKFAFADAGLKV